jgi:hypothetical protein
MLKLFDLKEDLLQWLLWKSFTPTLINYEVMRSHLRVNCERPWCTNRRNWTCQLVRSVWEVTLQNRILWSFQFRTECGRPKWELLEYDTSASNSTDSIDSVRLSEKFIKIIYYCYSIVIAYKIPDWSVTHTMHTQISALPNTKPTNIDFRSRGIGAVLDALG